MRRRNPGGFTLIEVMAAVFILGLFVAALSQLLTQARRNEGQARLQAHASELADLEIAKIEEGLARGAAPALGPSEQHVDDWTVRSEVTAFDADALAATVGAGAGGESARGAPSATAAAGGWLTSPQAQQAPPLLAIAVRVSWDGAPVDSETGEPFAMRRLTFALNPAALEALQEADGGDRSGEAGGEE